MNETSRGRKVFRLVLMTVLPLVVLAGGLLGFKALVESRRAPPRRERPHLGPLVRVSAVQPVDVWVEVEAHGTVRPAAEIDVVPQVGGEVVEVSPNLVTGGFVAAGEVLLRIDPRDYELQLRTAEAGVEQAKVQLERTEAEAAAAREEW
ncbi:MAG: biotin/lipoyl-binding protein, partial [Candidatus Dadabacteria bacterium]